MGAAPGLCVPQDRANAESRLRADENLLFDKLLS
jgi:hypothetical protein